MGLDEETRARVSLACVVAMALSLLLMLGIVAWTGMQRTQEQDQGGEVKYCPGQPLDAMYYVERDRPAWLPKCDRAYYVTDRTRNIHWWLLVMNEGTAREDYVTLPVTEEGR